MLGDRPRSRVSVLACLFLLFAFAPLAGRQQAPPPSQAAPAASTALPQEDLDAISNLVTQLYDARARKDAVLYASLWSPKAPRRVMAAYPPEYLFPFVSLKPGRVSVMRGRLEGATTARAQIAVAVTVAPSKDESPRQTVWVRDMGFVKEETGWHVWSEVPAADDVAMQIAQATTEEQRAQLLKDNAQVVNEELAIALEGQGDRHFQGGNYTAALSLYDLEGRIADQSHSPVAAARSQLKLGQLKQLTGVAVAIVAEHFKKALEGFASLNDRTRMASAEIGLGTTYYMKDDQASREHYKKAVDILETLSDRYSLASALHGYGNALFLIGDFSASLEAYNRAIEILSKVGTTAGVAAVRQAMGRVQREQGDYDASIDSYKRSLATFDALDSGTQWGGLKGLGDVYRAQGRFDFALEQYDRVLGLVKAALDQDTRTHALPLAKGDAQWVMSIESDTGNVYMEEQQPEAALAHYQKGLAVAQELGNQAGIARALGGIGTAQFSQLHYDEALAAFVQALPIHSALNDKGAIAWTHAHIGLVQAALEKHEDALASYQRAFDIANALSDAAATAVTMTLLATEHVELDHPDQALDLADRAASAARAIESEDTFAQARVITARVLRKQGDRDGAERALREAIDAVEAGRVKTGEEPRQDFFGDARAPYRAMALLMADANKPADALAFAERSQMQLLADALTGNRVLFTNGLSTAEQEEERGLSRTAKGLRAQVEKERLRPAPDATRLGALKDKLAEADQQRRAFADRIYTAHPSLKLQRGFFDAVGPADIAALVADAKTAVVEFVMTEKQTVALVLTRHAGTAPAAKPAATAPDAPQPDIAMQVLDIKAVDLSKRIREFRTLITQKDADVAKAAGDLYELLLKPLADALANRTRLVIVPDGPLWLLPFQALQDGGGKFLIERCAVSYAPSLSVLSLLERGALVTTDGSAHPAAKAAGPARVVAIGTQQAGTVTDRLLLLNPHANVKPIPNAEQEARQLGLVYGATRAKVLTGRAATRAAVLDAIAGDAALHLATVFVPSAASPMRSPFVLASRDAGEEVLEAWELMARPLPPATIISRVQAERGGSDGEVSIALGWVLFVGGTKAAVMATWPDDSSAAVTLMLDLHRTLIAPATASPASVSRVLRQAILELMATPQYRHPFYWANYAVLGVG